MTATADYYAILGVESSADDAAIRLAYRTLMRRYHPDVNRTDEAAGQAQSINEAYACLRDPQERAAYDRQRAAPRPGRVFTAGYRPTPPRGAGWQPPGQRPYVAEVEPAPTQIRAGILGLAVLVTFITFALTSATPPREPAPPAVVVDTAPIAAEEASSGIRSGP
nr:J domain-containing protein [uncultured Sphingomonas sp.]